MESQRGVDALVEAIRNSTSTLAAAQNALAVALTEAVRFLARGAIATPPAPAANEDRLLTVAEAADRLRVSPYTIYRYLKSRRLTCIVCGRKKLITIRDLQAFARKARVKSVDSSSRYPQAVDLPTSPAGQKEAS